jgi:hypothetical protein
MIWMTCLLDGWEHAVTDEQMAEGAPRGRYLSVCGRLVTPGSLFSPPGRRCRTCHATLTPAPAPRHPRPSWWRSLLKH